MRRLAPVVLGAAAWCGAPAGEPAPSWLDTRPPVVTVEPAPGSYNRVLTVTFSLDERGTVYAGRASSGPFEAVTKPITVVQDGRTVLYYYAEDLFDNRTPVDSLVYVLDSRSPKLTVTPPPGTYSPSVTVRLSADEPCRFFAHRSASDLPGTQIADTFAVTDSFAGCFSALDAAGNRTMGPMVRYVVGRATATVTIEPDGGSFRGSAAFTLRSSEPCTLFYSFDPQALPGDFARYRRPTAVPPGQTLVRYFGIDSRGLRTAIGVAAFQVDTAEVRVRIRAVPGVGADTLYLTARGAERIHYSFGPDLPTVKSPVYSAPLVVRRVGRARLWAFAVDQDGRQSPIAAWEQKYDFVAPQVSISPPGGMFNRSVRVTLRADEPAAIHYTLDGSAPTAASVTAQGEVVISRQGRTLLRCVAVDQAGNASEERSAVFTVDTIPPRVRARVEGVPGGKTWRVHLSADEEAQIYYQIGRTVTAGAGVAYHGPLELRPADILSYYAVDKAGNRGVVTVLDELAKPGVAALPRGGIYNHPLAVTFSAAPTTVVYYRLLPDTAFRIYTDTLRFGESGLYTVEYYAEGPGAGVGVMRREEYTVDLVAPRVRVTLRRGSGDTALVLFESSENATIYYTLDGTSPLSSPTTRTAAGSLLRSSDRVKVRRTPDARLAFYAEDAAGNQSRVSVMDLFKPRAVPNLPDGPEIVYDRVLSVSLYTLDAGRIHYARHGAVPTLDSAVYREPITLVRSDTICAFVVDRTGAAGDLDTFIYVIDLPPAPVFTVAPRQDSVMAGQTALFDAARTTDNESPVSRLEFRWDFDGDGVFDTPFAATPAATHVYGKPGIYRAVVEARDERRRVGRAEGEVSVRGECPAGMVFVPARDGGGFCIDRYEWPNESGTPPLTGVSWVEAKMHCFDSGKRLCTAREWEAACRGGSASPYPYGTEYTAGRCPTEGRKPHAAGSFPECGEAFGLRDMVGNVWEWVEDKQHGAPLQMGGSHRLGSLAHCGQTTEGRVAARAADVGFRCCR